MPWPKGKKRSPETRAKMVEAHRQRLHDPEALVQMEANLSKGRGATQSPEGLARIAKAQRDRIRSPEEIARLRIARLGSHASIETRRKMSATHKRDYKEGRRVAPAHVLSGEIGRRNKGRKQSPEERASRSIAQQKRWTAEGGKHRPETIAKMKDARARQEPVFRSKLEDTIAELLIALGLEFERNKSIVGLGRHQWDLVLFDRGILIEVDGCYWHGCSECGYDDRYNRKMIDIEQTEKARAIGWTVIRIPEHDIKAGKVPALLKAV